MTNEPDEKTQLDALIKAYNDIKQNNSTDNAQQNSQQTGKFKPIPLPAINPGKPESKQTKKQGE